MNYLVILAFAAIIGSLVVAMIYMLRAGDTGADADLPGSSATPPKKNHMARALAFRVGFSILLFVAVLISYHMGWIQPTGVPTGA